MKTIKTFKRLYSYLFGIVLLSCGGMQTIIKTFWCSFLFLFFYRGDCSKRKNKINLNKNVHKTFLSGFLLFFFSCARLFCLLSLRSFWMKKTNSWKQILKNIPLKKRWGRGRQYYGDYNPVIATEKCKKKQKSFQFFSSQFLHRLWKLSYQKYVRGHFDTPPLPFPVAIWLNAAK